MSIQLWMGHLYQPLSGHETLWSRGHKRAREVGGELWKVTSKHDRDVAGLLTEAMVT